ncbi:hypothetical protein BTR22_12675 [Alkalihalophilus pseudofirmus]|nr:hypothetical protein BTR22_12675 [Alkalihalophilus pseudofirmus]
MIGAEGTRLLRDVRDQGDPTGRKPEEAPGPPAESECLQRKSTTIIRGVLSTNLNSLEAFMYRSVI